MVIMIFNFDNFDKQALRTEWNKRWREGDPEPECRHSFGFWEQWEGDYRDKHHKVCSKCGYILEEYF